jgi:GNAT superfamily N-acetyltransferase
VLALIEDNTIVGLCQYGSTEDDDQDPDRVGEVHRLYVDPAYQGRSGGRLMLETASEVLYRDGKEAATHWVFEADRRARGFYEHLGWRPDGGRQQQAFPDIRYRLLLSS